MNVDKFVELNRAWLDKFEYNDYDKEQDYPAWWDGGHSFDERGDGLNVLCNTIVGCFWLSLGNKVISKEK